MANRRSQAKLKVKEIRSARLKFILISLMLSLIIGITVVAMRASLSPSTEPTAFQAQPTPLPLTKEYVYAGGKLVAIEDKAAGGGGGEPGIPPAPTGLTATGGNAQVALNWQPSSGATGYNIKRSTTSGSGFALVQGGVATSSYTDTTVSNSTNYYYVVSATNSAGGQSPDSAQASATPTGGGGLNSVSLNGSSQYVEVPTGTSFDFTGSFTVEAWINTNNPGLIQQSIVERYKSIQGSSDGGFALRLSNGKLQFFSIKNGFDQADAVTGASLVGSGWHHVAGVFDGGELRVYVDGVINGIKASTFAPAAGTSTLKIGGRGDDAGFRFSGLMDEVRISTGARYSGTSFIVQKQLTADGSTRGLWKFDGQSLLDSTTFHNNGSVAAGATYSTDTSALACALGSQPLPPVLASETIWIEDAYPGGSFAVGQWLWDMTQKAGGLQSHTEMHAFGIHQHLFMNSPQTITPGVGEKLICYVLVNPCRPPQEVMLQWLGPEGTWEHRAFWGPDLITTVGTFGTASRMPMGSMPAAGQWVRLEVPAATVGLESKVIGGMTYTLYDGHAWFDRAGKATGTTPPPANDAAFITQAAPPLQMTPGQTANVSVTMKNTGTATWSTASGYRLVSQNPAGNSSWGLSQVALSSSVATQAEVTFSFTVTAPATAGTYNLQWRMDQSGTAFGLPSTNVAVTVGSGGGGACPQASLVSGNGTPAYLEGTGSAARWNGPTGSVVANDPVSGLKSLFIADTQNHRIRMIYLEGPNAGLSILIAGAGASGSSIGADNAKFSLFRKPRGIAAQLDAEGKATALFIADTENHLIRKLLPPVGTTWREVATFAGLATAAGYVNGSGSDSRFNFPRGIVVAPDGFIYVADTSNGVIRKLDQAGNTSTFTAAGALSWPYGLTVSPSGVLYVSDIQTHNISRVSTGGVVTFLAGSGAATFVDGSGAAAGFNTPGHLVWSNTASGEVLYIADSLNHRIRKLLITGAVVSTYAGTGAAGYVEGLCNVAQFSQPIGVAVTSTGELYVSDTINQRIRKIQ